MDDALPEVIVHALAAWFRDHGRPYFFRRHPTAYSVWILEVMSQQTQIARAEERHRRWLEHFPDIQALAAASESEVLREWEGLGYYSRARNIHKAARQVLDAGGEMPATRDELIRLPGIGAYTAARLRPSCMANRWPHWMLMSGGSWRGCFPAGAFRTRRSARFWRPHFAPNRPVSSMRR